MGGWLENEFIKKTPSPKFGLESLLGTFDFGVCQKLKILRFVNLLPTRLCWATTTKPRQIERTSFVLLDHNRQTGIYRLVSGSFDFPLRRKHDSPMEEDDCNPTHHVR